MLVCASKSCDTIIFDHKCYKSEMKVFCQFLEVTAAAGIENTDDAPWLLRAIDVAFPGLIAAEDRSWILRGSMAPLENILQVLV